MKNIRVLTAFLCACGLFSCATPPTGVSVGAQRNIDIMHAIRQSIASKQYEKLGDYIDANCVSHPGGNMQFKGIDSIKESLRYWDSQADEKVEILKELADDDYLMSWGSSTGYYKTTADGHKSGDRFETHELVMVKMKDGKVIEYWSMLPQPDAMPKDTAVNRK